MTRINGILIKTEPTESPSTEDPSSPGTPPNSEYGTDGTTTEPMDTEPQPSVRIASFIVKPKQTQP